MKKEEWPRLLYLIAGLLALGFCIRLGVDYCQYSAAENSAPFWVWVLVRSIEFILPAAVCFAVGRLLKKKGTQKNDQCD